MKQWRILVFTVLGCAAAQAQWLNYTPAGTPKLKNGQVNLSAPAPRTADGKPDLTGVWEHEKTPLAELRRLYGAMVDNDLDNALPGMEITTVHKYGLNALIDFKPGESPAKPNVDVEMAKHREEMLTTNVCHNRYGWPVVDLLSEPMKLVQSPKEVVLLYEIDSLHRQIFADGRKFPDTVEFPAMLGYSVGRWDGDTFVVETRGFSDVTPIDGMGHPRSEQMHVTERFHRKDFGHLDYEITFDDPVYYTKPFTIKIPHNLVADNDIFEMFCNQNEKDRKHMVGKPEL